MNRNIQIMQNALSILVAAAVVVMTLAFAAVINRVDAAAVTITATPNEFDGTAAEDVDLNFVATQEFVSGDTITLTVAPALGAALTDCGTATTDVDGDATPDGAFGGFTTTEAVYTFTAGTTTATTSSDLCVQFPASTPQGSYSITMGSTNGDFGGVLVYVGDDNDVFVTAEVALSLSFNIRTADDTADTNSCAIGLVDTVASAASGGSKATPASTHECAYGLAIGTNATNGFQATIAADAAMTNGTDTVTDVTNGVAFAAGTEGYGIVEVFASETGSDGAGLFDQTITVDGDFATAVTPVPTVATNFVSYDDAIQYVAGTDNSDLSVVVHGMNAATTTEAGVYSQTVTYLVTPSF